MKPDVDGMSENVKPEIPDICDGVSQEEAESASSHCVPDGDNGIQSGHHSSIPRPTVSGEPLMPSTEQLPAVCSCKMEADGVCLHAADYLPLLGLSPSVAGQSGDSQTDTVGAQSGDSALGQCLS